MRPYGKTYRKSKVHKAKECRLCAERVGSKKTQRQRNKRESSMNKIEHPDRVVAGHEFEPEAIAALSMKHAGPTYSTEYKGELSDEGQRQVKAKSRPKKSRLCVKSGPKK